MREQTLISSLKNSFWPIIASIVILTLTGPFGTYQELPFFTRFQFWTLAILGGSMFIHVIVFYLTKLTNGSHPQKLGAGVLGSILGSAPAAALVIVIYSSMTGSEVPSAWYLSIWGNVAIIAVLVTFVHILPEIIIERIRSSGPASEPAQEEVEDEPIRLEHVPLLDLLPDGTRPCQIMSFSMQDHYVEIRTMEGVSLHLMTFSAAIEKLGDLKGARVHRSHWVSLRHIVDIQKDGRRHAAIMTDERKVPISGSYLEAARDLLKEKNATQ